VFPMAPASASYSHTRFCCAIPAIRATKSILRCGRTCGRIAGCPIPIICCRYILRSYRTARGPGICGTKHLCRPV
ncbi:MAG: hypothetical protein AVDCRST_MAG93-2141, partial [uncultured Chloroflexia bacterium]